MVGDEENLRFLNNLKHLILGQILKKFCKDFERDNKLFSLKFKLLHVFQNIWI